MTPAELQTMWKRELAGFSITGPVELYKSDAAYLATTVAWESGRRKQAVYAALKKWFPERGFALMDLGCASGLTGMTALLEGYRHCTFCDYEGVALDVLRKMLPGVPEFKERYSIVPYGRESPVDVVLVTDVIEHVGNHLSLLRWAAELSREGFIMTYPLRPFNRPYEDITQPHDEWVDDEAIRMVLQSRYDVLEWVKLDGGRMAVVRT